jgi:hypothetical protein
MNVASRFGVFLAASLSAVGEGFALDDAGDDYSAHGCDSGFEGASPTNPEGGPESRLWAAVARRGQGRPNSLARRTILTAWRSTISMPSS